MRQTITKVPGLYRLASRLKKYLQFETPPLPNIHPQLTENYRRKRLLVLPIESWGSLIQLDQKPDFEIVTYSYTGSSYPPNYLKPISPLRHFEFITNSWGESFFLVLKKISTCLDHEVVLFLNGDVSLSVSGINRLFFLSDLYRLDVFQAALSHDSFYTYSHLLHKPSRMVEAVPFIENMMPGLSRKVIDEIVRIGLYTISGWGLDVYLYPYIIKYNNLRPAAVIHDVIAIHCKPVESPKLILKNGLTPLEEFQNFKLALERHAANER